LIRELNPAILHFYMHTNRELPFMDPADRLAIRLTTAAIDAALEAQRALAAEARATQRLVDELAQRQAQLRHEGQRSAHGSLPLNRPPG
jgi:hypothetical protein